MAQWTMARFVRTLMALLLIIGVAGCGGSPPTTQPAAQSTPTMPPDTPTPNHDDASEESIADDSTNEHDHATQPAAQSTPTMPPDTPTPNHDDASEESIAPATATEDDHTADDSASPDLSAITPVADGETLNVVATTNIVGDVVHNVGGDAINLTVLMPLGTDPHSFEPTPRDLVTITEADIIFANGVGLEVFLDSMLESAGVSEGRVIHVSHGIELIEFAGQHEHAPAEDAEHEHAPAEDAEHAPAEDADHEHAPAEDADHEHDHSGLDPHVWFSPISVVGWVDTIEQTLGHADPTNADTYTTSATTYRDELHALDAWIMEQVEQVPEDNRKLVTDHTAFGYFAHRYGFQQIGAVIPAYSTMAEPSAQEIAALEDAIRTHQVPAIFVGTTVNPNLSERIADDTGTELVSLYTGSLSEPGGPADTYVKLMRFNTQAIVAALQ